MQDCKLHIVALPYCEVGECLGEFMAEAKGRAMTVRPDEGNEYDAMAIRAYDWQGRHVGYVAAHDLLEAWQMLRGSGRRSLRGRIVEVNAEHKCVVFECKVETLGEVGELYPQACFREWTYTGPVLRPTKEFKTLDYMMDEIRDRLDEQELWDDEERHNFVVLTTRFCELSRYDLSGEMSDYRRQLCLRLMDESDPALAQLAEELKMACGRMGREAHGGEVLQYWMQIVDNPRSISSLLKGRDTMFIDDVLQELEAFPDEMFEVWKADREHFVSKLAYMHVPREVLWKLVSGIAFYEAAKRCEAERVEESMKMVEEARANDASCFKFTDGYTIQRVAAVVKEFYHGKAVNLAVIEAALFDHNLLYKRDSHTAFIKALIHWHIVKNMTDEDITKIANGMSQKMKKMPEGGYKGWKGCDNERALCMKIEKALGADFPYDATRSGEN